jgi:hypothetical protein
VFSCKDGLTHAPDINVQMGTPNTDDAFYFDLLTTKPTHPNCPVDIKYSVKIKKGSTGGVIYAPKLSGKDIK